MEEEVQLPGDRVSLQPETGAINTGSNPSPVPAVAGARHQRSYRQTAYTYPWTGTLRQFTKGCPSCFSSSHLLDPVTSNSTEKAPCAS